MGGSRYGVGHCICPHVVDWLEGLPVNRLTAVWQVEREEGSQIELQHLLGCEKGET
jgi:hypothetical protein